MPSISLCPPDPTRHEKLAGATNPLPQLLQTPSGLAIVEIQGTLNVPHLHSSSDGDVDMAVENQQVDVGRLVFPDYSPDTPLDDTSWTKRIYLYVGMHQRLTGEVKKLVDPIAVVSRKMLSETGANETSDVDELQILEIVRWKIIFSNRPEPVGT
ncbi:MAG: hypothetical protein M1823_002959 [Watsoniomyces obsoletus]|nr:MAG: hypothetical protein M1823_002959 [Watsoniomyces obsoletus]